MITKKDFAQVLLAAASDTNMQVQCFELAKKMAFEFAEFKRNYQRIEGQNVSYYQRKRGLGMFTWRGSSDEKIFAAYLKGEQLKDEFEEDLKRERHPDQSWYVYSCQGEPVYVPSSSLPASPYMAGPLTYAQAKEYINKNRSQHE
jgi:hypothetical protein